MSITSFQRHFQLLIDALYFFVHALRPRSVPPRPSPSPSPRKSAQQKSETETEAHARAETLRWVNIFDENEIWAKREKRMLKLEILLPY